jgi:oxygen-independent coproporphyrinogen III oxidase
MSLLEQIIAHPRFSRRSNEYLRWYPKSLCPISSRPLWDAQSVQGAYIHVPFCDRLCTFCPFNKVVTQAATVARYLRALACEIGALSHDVGRGPLRFVYFGGGTPSVLAPSEVEEVLAEMDAAWGLSSDVEVTLETHPTHADINRLKGFASAGVTRVSIGVQSFHEELLEALGATHNASDSHRAVANATSLFANVAIDLLYRYRPQTPREWGQDLEAAIDGYGVRHVSCYALVPTGAESAPDMADRPSESDEVEFALQALDLARSHGLDHYASCASGGFDVSTSDRKCRYEFEHWSAPQGTFVGLGPGAFGFAGGHATVNRLSLGRYCSTLERGDSPLASAVRVSNAEMRHRYFVLGVKALAVPLGPYRARFGTDPVTDFAAQFRSLEADGFADVKDDALVLTPVGRLFVDTCSSLFFSESQRVVPHPEEPEIRAIDIRVSESTA